MDGQGSYTCNCPLDLRGNRCQSGNLLVERSITWHAARDYCIDIGGKLMEPKTQTQVDDAIRLQDGIPIWLGGSKEADGSTWVWISDNSLVDMESFWHPGSPNPRFDDYHYLALNSVGNFADNNGWNYDANTFHFICTF